MCVGFGVVFFFLLVKSHCGFVNLVKQIGLGQTYWLPGFLFALRGGGPSCQLQRSPSIQQTFKKQRKAEKGLCKFSKEHIG